jgi:hypothetical protein
MSLLSRLRDKQAAKIATVTSATFATKSSGRGRAVASVAAVDVARSPLQQIAATVKVGEVDAVTTSRWWLIHYLELDPLKVACFPEATRADILGRYPAAVAVEPFTLMIRQASAPLTANEEMAIRAWLALIEETDPLVIAEVIAQCERDAGVRDYFQTRALAELPKPSASPDDRRTCYQCVDLKALRCQAAKRAEINASRAYEPIRDLPQCCEGHVQTADDPDRRPGRERWSMHIHKGKE